jgi:biotin carboxylase
MIRRIFLGAVALGGSAIGLVRLIGRRRPAVAPTAEPVASEAPTVSEPAPAALAPEPSEPAEPEVEPAAASEPPEPAPSERRARPRAPKGPVLRGVPAIRRFFRTTETPIYFVSATAFNLLGIDRWVRDLRYINYFDSFDGGHPGVFVPKERSDPPFGSIEEICNYLLGHKEVIDFVRGRKPVGAPSAGKACFLMFDEETETLVREAGLDLAFPSAALRNRLDSKIVTTELGNEAGVPSVPNVLGRARSYEELLGLARGGQLGSDLVVQTPYGDSGQTTFFIANGADWAKHAAKMVDEQLKVMRRIRARETAIEAVVTRHGTLVGPLMTELVGFPELTPYGGGWCGDEVYGTALSHDLRVLARERTKAIGERLRQEGYRGYFELDFLADQDTGELWLGELNPRVTGASSMTNVSAVAYGDMPLFLFHLLEFMDVDYEIDVEELNARWAEPANVDTWAQWILKETDPRVELLTAAPASGVWRMADDRSIRYARTATDWHSIRHEKEAFYLRIANAGGYRYKGADMGILVTRGRFMDDAGELTERAHDWIRGITAQFAGLPIEPAVAEAAIPKPDPFGFKLL